MLRPSAALAVTRALTQRRALSELKLLGSQRTRQIQTTPVRAASYRRFGESHQSSPPVRTKSGGPATFQRFGGSGGGDSRLDGLWKRIPSPLLLGTVSVGCVTYYVYHLEKVPETGRWRFIDVGPELERQMADETFRSTLATYKGRILPASHPHSRLVRSVASRVVAALDRAVEHQPDHTRGDSGLDHHSHGKEGGIQYGSVASGTSSSGSSSNTKWEVFVIDDPKQKNAFVLPGGKIFVFTGILPICQNVDGVATVLSHEVAHQVARHSAERLSGYRAIIAISSLLELLSLDIGLSRTGLTFLHTLPNSRVMEMEADHLGLRIMSRACFDPREASKLWTRMSESEGESGGGGILSSARELLSTHPLSRKRVVQMQEWLPEALSMRDNSGCPPLQQVNAFKDAMTYTNRS